MKKSEAYEEAVFMLEDFSNDRPVEVHRLLLEANYDESDLKIIRDLCKEKFQNLEGIKDITIRSLAVHISFTAPQVVTGTTDITNFMELFENELQEWHGVIYYNYNFYMM